VQSNLIRKNKTLKESLHNKLSVLSPRGKGINLSNVRKNLSKYNFNQTEYQKKIITDLIYDEKKHIVAVFKEHLIWDDMAEFLIR
jgi:hypothetical protein